MVQLQKDNEQLAAANLQVVGVSYDSVAVLSGFAEKHKVTFPLLSDATSKVIDAFGVRNARASGRQDGIPHPLTIVIDQQGVIRAKLPGTVRQRHSSQELIKAGKTLGAG